MGHQDITDQEARFTLMAYNGLLQRAAMLNGVGMSNTEMLKIQLIKRLTNKGYNLQVCGINCIREFLKDARIEEENARLEAERQMKEKERILRRIMNSNLRFAGMAFRQALQWTVAAREAEIALAKRMRGICNRIVDSSVRLMGMGYNKLLEEWKAKQAAMREKLRFVIATLTDKDKQCIMMGHGQLKQRKLMLGGVGFGDDVAQKLKIRLIRKLTDVAYNMQVMGVNCIKEWLASERIREENARLEAERQMKEKSRILKRIMDSNVRFMGIGFRQALQWTVAEREAEIALMAKQRGIMRRIVDSNTRLMSAGYNKLLEEWKARQANMKEKLRFVIAALTDKDKMFTMMAYNGMKQRCLMLSGVGMNNTEMLKIQLIKRLTNKGYNLQVCGINCIREFLVSERNNDELARLEAERQMKEKERILRRIMNSNLRFAGMAFRQALQWTVAEREREIATAKKMRGIMNRMVDANVRLMGMGYNKLVEEWKARQAEMKEKLRFVIAALTDKDKMFKLMAYNGLQQRAAMLNGAGMSNTGMLKLQLIKRLTNKGYSMQVMGINCIREFLKDARIEEENAT